MVNFLNDPTLMARVSLVLLFLQPLTYVRKVKRVLDNWNPVVRFRQSSDWANNEQRIREAEQYFQYVTPLNTSAANQNTEADGTLEMAIVIVTVNRARGHYLIQSAARMRELLVTDDSCDKRTLLICNVDDNPDGHKDAVYLKQFMNYLDKSGKSNFKLPYPPSTVHITGEYPIHRQRRKEIEDYIFCLNVGRSLNPKYVFMLEDDIIPHPDLFPIAMHKLDHAEDGGNDDFKGHIDNLKLFSFDHLSSFREYVVQVIRNYSIAVVFGVMCVLFVSSLRIRRPYTFYLVMFTRSMLACSIFVLFVGNNFYFELLRYSYDLYTLEPMQRSSSAALIFRSDMLDNLVNYLLHTNTGIDEEGNKDLAIDTFIQSTGMRSHLVRPYLIEHIGTVSSLTPVS